MGNYELLSEHRKEQLNKIEGMLKKSSELIAFINVYGGLFDSQYSIIISNINSLVEHYLKTSNSDIINTLYDIYITAKNNNKSEKEIFSQLKEAINSLSYFSINETKNNKIK